MLIGFGRLWSWWTESWRSARRARLQYVAMALAFAALAIIAAFVGEPAVAVVAGAAALLTGALALLASRLARWTRDGGGRSVQ